MCQEKRRQPEKPFSDQEDEPVSMIGIEHVGGTRWVQIRVSGRPPTLSNVYRGPGKKRLEERELEESLYGKVSGYHDKSSQTLMYTFPFLLVRNCHKNEPFRSIPTLPSVHLFPSSSTSMTDGKRSPTVFSRFQMRDKASTGHRTYCYIFPIGSMVGINTRLIDNWHPTCKMWQSLLFSEV